MFWFVAIFMHRADRDQIRSKEESSEKAEPERRMKRRIKKRNFLKELKLKIERFFFLGERNRNKEKQFTLYNIEGCFMFLNSIVILYVMKLNDQLITANTWCNRKFLFHTIIDSWDEKKSICNNISIDIVLVFHFSSI